MTVIMLVIQHWHLFGPRNASTDTTSTQIFIAKKQVVINKLLAVGSVEPGRIVNVVGPLNGAVQNKYFEYGNQVEQGQLLLEINSTELEAKIRDAQAVMLKSARAFHDLEAWNNRPEVSRARRGVIAAQISLEEAQRKAMETAMLLERGIVSKMEHDASVQQVNTQELQFAAAKEDFESTLQKGDAGNRQIARLESESARKKFEELSAEIGRKSILAPVSGVILQAPANVTGASPPLPIVVGGRVTQGQIMFSIANNETLAVIAKVDEIDVNQLQKGQAVEVTGDAFHSSPAQGVVSRISAQALPNGSSSKTATFEITVTIPKLTAEQKKIIRVGMSSRLSIIRYQNMNAIVLPTAAVHQVNGKSFVSIKNLPKGQPKKTEVVLGQAVESGIEILEGVHEGDQIIIDNGTPNYHLPHMKPAVNKNTP
ncbi:efflux RND transporter periplasmic adaptor subunit [Herminiimonas sp. CN]|uniref:efflux RND transporter periplasmic adaptor subunit n=1 Tax=Herminiimonas sp. CN TaxID=1349818 RepID=UPI00138E1D84|nr:HlyD family efflux transporter periplasmic adaptor subunit [Herminiimonas sp. CN]